MSIASSIQATTPWPTDIAYSRSTRELRVTFETGEVVTLSATTLRTESPSAEVQGHGEGKKIVTGKENVAITAIEPVGNYAVRLMFDDGHRTGLYSWAYLHNLGTKKN
jgi:DUF971 family protein